jgi:hypothetical protein
LKELGGTALMAIRSEDETGGEEGPATAGKGQIINGPAQFNYYPIMINSTSSPPPHSNLAQPIKMKLIIANYSPRDNVTIAVDGAGLVLAQILAGGGK